MRNSILNILIFFRFRPHFGEKSIYWLTLPRATSQLTLPRIASELTLELTLKLTLKVTLKSTHWTYFERKINILDHIVLILKQSALYRFALKLWRSHNTSPCVDLIQKRPHRHTLSMNIVQGVLSSSKILVNVFTSSGILFLNVMSEMLKPLHNPSSVSEIH